MRKGFLSSLTVLLASTSLALAQPAAPVTLPPPPTTPAEETSIPGPDGPRPVPAPGTLGDPAPGRPSHPPVNPVIPPRTTPPNYPAMVSEAAPDTYPPYCWYGGVEYLHWWMRGIPTPPLVTTGTAASRGALIPGTQVVIGDQALRGREENGYRVTLGTLVAPDCSVEASYFFLNQEGGAAVQSLGTPVLGRPFFNVVTRRPDAAVVALPGLVAGGVQVREDSQLWGGEVNFREKLYCSEHFNVHGMLGARYLQLNEGLFIAENVAILPTVPIIGGLRALALDQFGTRNNFYGGQVGAEAEWDCGHFFINGRAKIALGEDLETSVITGTTRQTGPRLQSTVNAGFLALPSNIGRRNRSVFSVLPEAGVNVGFVVNDWLRVSAGYNFLYLTDVLRPGNQIDQGINPAQGLPGSFGRGGPALPARPAFNFKESDFWAQGLNVSVEFRF